MISARDFHDYISGKRRGAGAILVRTGLWVLSKGYAVGVAVRNWQFDSNRRPAEHPGVPVISVGNLTLGGTGKTPMVAFLAKWFRERNIRVTLISRGYGAEAGGQNDEAKELEQFLPDVPHLQNPKRIEAAQVAVEELAAQVLVLDDAFQHRQIARDLDIVLLDATQPFGYGHLFPRGTLREPSRSLARADVVVLTRSDMVSTADTAEIWRRVAQLNDRTVCAELVHEPTAWINADGQSLPIEEFAGQRVLAFCGIGNPVGFRHSLQQAGVQMAELREFPDHHAYDREDIDALTEWIDAHPACEAVLCTMKDLVKIGINELAGKPVWALQISAKLTLGESELVAKLQDIADHLPPDPYAEDESPCK